MSTSDRISAYAHETSEFMAKNRKTENGMTIAQEATKAWLNLLQFVSDRGFLKQIAEDMAPKTKGLHLLRQDKFDVILRDDGKLILLDAETRAFINEIEPEALSKRHKPVVCIRALETAFQRRHAKEKQAYEEAEQAVEISQRLMA